MRRLAMTVLVCLALAGCSASPNAAPLTLTPEAPPAPTQEPAAEKPASEQSADGPSLISVPTPDEMCVKPPDDSGIVFNLYKIPGDSVFSIRPGWAVPFPAHAFTVGVRFPNAIDSSSVKVTVEPAPWQFVSQPAHPLPEFFLLGVFPDGEIKAGPIGWVTVTLEGAKSMAGEPLQEGPISFKIWAYEALMPGETLPPCPGLEPPANTSGQPTEGDGAGYAGAKVRAYLEGVAAGQPVEHLLVDGGLEAPAGLADLQVLGMVSMESVVEAADRVRFVTTVPVEPRAGGEQRQESYEAVVVLRADQWRVESITRLEP